jgi:hypothetical protein
MRGGKQQLSLLQTHANRAEIDEPGGSHSSVAEVLSSLEQIEKFMTVANQLKPQFSELAGRWIFQLLIGSEFFRLSFFH